VSRPELRSRICAVIHRTAEHVDLLGPATLPGTGVVQVVRSGCTSAVRRALATSPLKLLTPRNHGAAAWIYTATYGGGLVGGDAVRLVVDVAPGAMALLTTQASTKVYRSHKGTSVDLEAVVHDDGVLVVWPDPVVCFAASTYSQTQRFDLGRAAGLVVVDWFSSGRHGAGERWAFDRYASRMRIRIDGRLVLHDALSLCAADGDLTARMGRFELVSAVAIAGTRLRAHAAEALERVAQTPVRARSNLLVAASPIDDGGCIVRIAGVIFEEVERAIRDLLGFVPSVLGDNPWARKW
jgi:urease accessory protein